MEGDSPRLTDEGARHGKQARLPDLCQVEDGIAGSILDAGIGIPNLQGKHRNDLFSGQHYNRRPGRLGRPTFSRRVGSTSEVRDAVSRGAALAPASTSWCSTCVIQTVSHARCASPLTTLSLPPL